MLGVDVDIVMSALDADVIKTYVYRTWALVSSTMWRMTSECDYRLKQIPTDIFGVNTTWIAVRKGTPTDVAMAMSLSRFVLTKMQILKH